MLGEKILRRLRVFAAVVAVAVVAVAACAAVAPERAWAADGYTLGYRDTPIEDVLDLPGFKWVNPTDTEPGHYLVYDPLDNQWDGTAYEECAGWWYFAEASREHDFAGYLVKLDSNINFNAFNYDRNPSAGRTQLSVGSEDMPFRGTFDGQNYTISNLSNNREGLKIVIDCGFFGQTDGATIKNLNLSNCYVGASFRSGVLVGLARCTLIENVTLTGCTSSVVPGNNVLNLVTNGGMSAGILAGETYNSTLYDCEVKNGTAVCNATIGVGALGGQPLYLGAMVGFATDSVIEYCRVTPDTGEDGKIVPPSDGDDTGGRTDVSMHYDTAVGAVAACEVYVGGLVGGANTSKEGNDAGTPTQIIDCFSTADLNSYAACYISVGAGTAGYLGGIVGRTGQSVDALDSVNPVYVERCSFSGDMSSRQVNSILVLPVIIEDNKFLAAIVGRDSSNAVVQNCYYNASMAAASIDGDTSKIVATQDGTGSNDNVTYGSTIGPKDSQYEDVSFWEGCGFDFGGSVVRTAKYPACYNGESIAPETDSLLADGEGHSNKWVMDYNIGIPVHGGNFMATFDFPGAGKVEIGMTSLDVAHDGAGEGATPSWQTSNPYDFAQQGFTSADDNATLTYEEAQNPALGDTTNNTGWRVEGWYRQQGVGVTSVAENHGVFTEDESVLGKGPIIKNGDKLFEGSEGQTSIMLRNNVEGDTNDDIVDGDLCVAYLKANVIYHDVAGNMLDTSGNPQNAVDAEKDWYDYGQQFNLLNAVGEGAVKPSSETATLIGWTTEPNGDKGHESITSAELDGLKRNGTFYELGATFIVDAPENLYPVYADQISNVNVIYEGHERFASDGADVLNVRPQFGRADVKTDADGDIYLSVTPEDGGTLESGAVRFLGWYENVGTNDSPNWVRVSKGEQLELNDTDGSYTNPPQAGTEYFKFNLTDAGVDLNTQHTYMARFEYRVDYYLYSGSSDVLYKKWELYNASFDDLGLLESWGLDVGYHDNAMTAWWTGKTCDDPMSGDAFRETVEHQELNTWGVQYPMEVHGHWENRNPDGAMDMVVTTDFPGSGELVAEFGHLSLAVHLKVAPNQGYHFGAWTLDWSNGGDNRLGLLNPSGPNATQVSETIDGDKTWYDWNCGTSWYYHGTYWAEAAMTADVTFDVPSVDSMTVQRRYQQKLFVDTSTETDVLFHYDKTAAAYKIKTEGTRVSSPPSFDVDWTAQQNAPDGYAFIGWIDESAVDFASDTGEIKQAEWNWIFENGDADSGKVAHVERVVPYLIDEDVARCTRVMKLQAVYVPIDIETTTNIREAGVPDSYNKPAIPSVECTSEGADTYTYEDIVYTPDDFDKSTELVNGYELGEGGSVKLKYDRQGNATVKVTADIETFLKGDADDTYRLVSVTMTIDGGEPVTLAADESTTNEFTVPITLGHSYVFTANYKPVPIEVTYHLHDGEGTEENPATDVKSCEVGDLLPATSYSPSYEVPNAFFVGWTEDNERTSGSVTWSEDVKLVQPGKDVVTHSMDLWPVYRSATISVRSNIDDAVEPDPASMSTVAGDAEGLYLNAAAVSGYEFVGWTASDTYPAADGSFENFAPFSTSQTHRLSGGDRFSGTTYTAVYRSAYTVVYHDLNGDELYTQSLSAGQALSVEQEIDGEETWTVRDSEPFVLINSAISQNNASGDATYQEQFVSWAMVDGSGQVTEWKDEENNFSRTAIEKLADLSTKRIDLYPVTMQFSAWDSNDSNYSSSLIWSLSVDKTTGETSASIQLKGEYNQSHLKVHVDKVTHKEGLSPEAQDGIPVKLYGPEGSGGVALGSDTTRSDTVTVGNVQLEKGDALFTFTGYLEITKVTKDVNAAGRTFSFTVTPESGDARTVNVTVGETADDAGNYTGTARLTLPYGNYTVSEDEGWAWRYDATTQTWDADKGVWTGENNSARVTVKYVGVESADGDTNVLAPVRVQTTNTLSNEKWFDGEDLRHNVFGKGSE